ncbi:alkaline phosphatase D family protein [Yinghuangia aomiensis]
MGIPAAGHSGPRSAAVTFPRHDQTPFATPGLHPAHRRRVGCRRGRNRHRTPAHAAEGPDAAAAAQSGSEAFRHGVASGDPLPGAVVIWTRVTPEPDCRPGRGRGPAVHVGWEDRDRPRVPPPVRSGTAAPGRNADHTVNVDVRGLRPGTAYFYRFRAGRAVSPVGRTRTAPAAHAKVDGLRFGIASCVSYSNGYFAAYRHLAERTDLDAVIHLGDYIYEFGSGAGHPGSTDVRPMDPVTECRTLADYRARHGEYRTDPDPQSLHASAPIIATWDDHETCGDTWSGAPATTTRPPKARGPPGSPPPARPTSNGSPSSQAVPGSTQRRLAFGTLADLTMLDLRSFRSQQALPTDIAALDDPARTITGASQMAWLRTASPAAPPPGTSSAARSWRAP